MTRALTREELDDIVDFIKPQRGIPEESALFIQELNKEKIRKQLKNQEIYPSLIPSLKAQVEKYYFSSIISPGESVGVICSQSLGQQATQNTLNSVAWNEQIMYVQNRVVKVEKIGEMIDNLLHSTEKENIEFIEENRTE